jgi:hypothetical protein
MSNGQPQPNDPMLVAFNRGKSRQRSLGGLSVPPDSPPTPNDLARDTKAFEGSEKLDRGGTTK